MILPKAPCRRTLNIWNQAQNSLIWIKAAPRLPAYEEYILTEGAS